MDLTFDLGEFLSFSISPIETVLRGTLMYWFLFLMFRFVARRDIGSMGIADLLIVVIVADAAQNGMAGKGDGVADAMLLVGTLIGWNRLLDTAAFYIPAIRRMMDPPRVMLIDRGKKRFANMRRHSITDNELEAKMHEHGVDAIDKVKAMYLEPDGEISVITE
jgi:uncharacterized membrane protein YcaP (DUF421 family)